MEWKQEALPKPPMEAFSDGWIASKRQRRPSVRLGEIGDLPAAIINEPYWKRKKPLPSHTNHSGLGDATALSDGNGNVEFSALDKASKVPKARPPVPAHNGNLQEQNSGNDGQDPCGHFRSPDSLSPLPAMPAENQSELQWMSQGGAGGRRMQHTVKIANRKGRNGKRRPGGPRGMAPFDKLTKAVASVIEIGDNDNEKASVVNDTTDPHSEDAYDSDTPEGFRDCDLEASDYDKDVKERSNSQDEVGPPVVHTSIGASLEYQQEYHSPQFSHEHNLEQDHEPRERSEDREGSANNQVATIGSRREALETSSDAEGKLLTEKVRPLHEGKSKLTSEANGNSENREPASENAEQLFKRSQSGMRQYSSLVNGVRGWLQSLGLGTYVQLFETHEVDTEVLPLLTLDDLKEMGIAAVGTRRKMFYAIQQLSKGLIGRADS